jgi:Raf kinase inhibitor-like YbhB/YbcL family protein
MTLILTSSAFADGARIPELYSCEGADISPPLAWSGAPDETRSFALLCDDPDAPAGTWTHWAIFDIAADASGLREGYPKGARVDDVRQAVTDFGHAGYGGPCPPRGHGVHHYYFRVLALDVGRLDVPEKATFRDVEKIAEAHVLARADLTGTYSRD